MVNNKKIQEKNFFIRSLFTLNLIEIYNFFKNNRAKKVLKVPIYNLKILQLKILI